jgi:hypothetical protein
MRAVRAGDRGRDAPSQPQRWQCGCSILDTADQGLPSCSEQRRVRSISLKQLSFSDNCFFQPERRNNSRRDETISSFGADIRKQPLVNEFDNENGGQRRHPKPETVKCEPSASSLLSPSCWLAPRSPARRMPACRALAPSPITARRSALQPLRLSLLQPAEAPLS